MVSVADVGAALKALDEAARFDLAIVDVKLGGTATSTAVTGKLIEHGIPFVFLTGMRSDDVRVAHPHVPVIEKPYVAEVLMEALHKVLARQ